MAVRTTNDTKNLRLGSGRLYAGELDPNGNILNWRYFGFTPDFSGKVTEETVEFMDPDNIPASVIASDTVSVGGELSFTCSEVVEDNLASFFKATITPITQAAATAITLAITTPVAARHYELGKIKVSNVVVEKTSDSTPFTAGVDYTVDLDRGTIYILPNGAIPGVGTTITFDCALTEYSMLDIGQASTSNMAIRFESDMIRGAKVDPVFYNVKVQPDGDYNFKTGSKEYGSMKFKGTVMKRVSDNKIGTMVVR